MGIGRWMVGTAVMLLVPAGAFAQPAAESLEQLKMLVQPGDRLSITATTGERTIGRLAGIDAERLTLEVDGRPRSWTDDDIAQIEQRRDDSLKNGLIIGAVSGCVVGAGLGLLFSHIDDDGAGVSVTGATASLAMMSAMGAGIGALIDAAVRRQQVVYRANGAGARVSFAPVVTPTTKGARVTWRF